MIYFVQRADGAIKIGTSEQVRTRKRELAKQHGALTALGFMDGSYELEEFLHATFSDHRINPRSEWFLPVPDLLEYIAAHTHQNMGGDAHIVRVSQRLHSWLKVLSKSTGKTISEILEDVVLSQHPELEDVS